MSKKILIALLMITAFAGHAAAQDDEGYIWGVNAGAEMNMNSGNHYELHNIAALGFGVHTGGEYNISDIFAAGLNLNFSFSDLFAFEAAGFFRWYFLRGLPKEAGFFRNIFAQADLGVWAGNDSHSEAVKFLGGTSAGIRFKLPVNFYIEPYARFGYPFLFGVGVTAGYRFKGTAQVDTKPSGAAPSHEHSYSEELSSSATQHWKECTGADCEEKTELANHAPKDGICDICGYDNTPVKSEDAIITDTLDPITSHKAYSKFPVTQVRDCQRSPAYPANGQSMTLRSFSVPLSDINMTTLTSTVINTEGAYFQMKEADNYTEDNKNLVLEFYNADGSLLQEVARGGHIHMFFEEGFLYIGASNDIGYVFFYEPLNNRTSITVTSFDMR